jgi:hypothetical protein
MTQKVRPALVENNQGLRGIYLDGAVALRPENSWSDARNFDLNVEGSLRKVLGNTELVPDLVYEFPIVAATVYRRTLESERTVVGIDEAGTVYDLETGFVLTSIPVATVGPRPSLLVMPGLSGNTRINYLIVTTEGGSVYKWDGVTLNPVTVVGCIPADMATTIRSLYYNTDEQRGIPILASRRYRWTWYNPTTKLDSSPSEITEVGEPWPSVIAQGATLYPPPNTLVTMVSLFGPTTRVGKYGDGYTRVRWWTSQDGGQTFYLNTGIRAWNGATLQLPNSEGSYELHANYFDGIPQLVDLSGSGGTVADTLLGDSPSPAQLVIFGLATPRSPTPDSALVEPAPDDGQNDPPPDTTFAAVYQSRVFYAQGAKLVFSNALSFEQCAQDNFIVVQGDAYDEIIALHAHSQELLIGRTRATHRLIGVDFRDFSLNAVNPDDGLVARRGHIEYRQQLYSLSRQGLTLWSAGPPVFFGKQIRPFTDSVVAPEAVLAASDTNQALVLFSGLFKGQYWIIVINTVMKNEPTFVGPFASEITMLQEVELFDGTFTVLFGDATGRVYKLFVEDGPVVAALAVSQQLPQTDLSSYKVFRVLRVEGPVQEDTPSVEAQPIPGWEFSCRVDLQPATAWQPLYNFNFIGLRGKRLVVSFRHIVATVGGARALLPGYTVDFVAVGESF